MTAAYETSSASLVQKLRILCQCPTLRRDQFLKPFNAKDAGKPLHILGILVDRPTQSRGTPVGFTAHFCRDVKFHHRIHELIDPLLAQRSECHQAVERLRFVETAHAHCPLDRLSFPVEHEPAVRLATNCAHPEIDVSGSSCVEA